MVFTQGQAQLYVAASRIKREISLAAAAAVAYGHSDAAIMTDGGKRSYSLHVM